MVSRILMNEIKQRQWAAQRPSAKRSPLKRRRRRRTFR